tara:strand:+ start:119 stop:337 length:219 start_codon:yes stop_codon:yes gene_type:complete
MQNEIIKNPTDQTLQMIKLYSSVDAKGKQLILDSVQTIMNSMYTHYLSSVKYKTKIETAIKLKSKSDESCKK